VPQSVAEYRRFMGEPIMARTTGEEADALDELWTRTTPEIDTGKPAS
jgi:hypothetical protein